MNQKNRDQLPQIPKNLAHNLQAQIQQATKTLQLQQHNKIDMASLLGKTGQIGAMKLGQPNPMANRANMLNSAQRLLVSSAGFWIYWWTSKVCFRFFNRSLSCIFIFQFFEYVDKVSIISFFRIHWTTQLVISPISKTRRTLTLRKSSWTKTPILTADPQYNHSRWMIYST